MYAYTPANVPGLLAGWEINLYESEDYITLSLWRVRAMLKPYKGTRYKGDDALHYTGGRYADAYLPLEHTEEDLNEALQELVCSAIKFDATLDETERWLNEGLPKQANRPSRAEYFNKPYGKR